MVFKILYMAAWHSPEEIERVLDATATCAVLCKVKYVLDIVYYLKLSTERTTFGDGCFTCWNGIKQNKWSFSMTYCRFVWNQKLDTHASFQASPYGSRWAHNGALWWIHDSGINVCNLHFHQFETHCVQVCYYHYFRNWQIKFRPNDLPTIFQRVLSLPLDETTKFFTLVTFARLKHGYSGTRPLQLQTFKNSCYRISWSETLRDECQPTWLCRFSGGYQKEVLSFHHRRCSSFKHSICGLHTASITISKQSLLISIATIKKCEDQASLFVDYFQSVYNGYFRPLNSDTSCLQCNIMVLFIHLQSFAGE